MQHFKQYTARSGRQQFKPAQGLLVSLIESDANQGFCLACASCLDGIEPDAGQETCPNCGEPKAYGAEELLLNGLYFDENREADKQTAQRMGFIR